jgi:hypothetical protein
LHKITTVLANRRRNKNRPVRNKKGEFLTGWEEQASRWREHFSEMSNHKEKGNEELRVTLGENSVITMESPTEPEIRQAVRQNVPPETRKSDNQT